MHSFYTLKFLAMSAMEVSLIRTVCNFCCRYNLYSHSFIPAPPGGLNSGLMLMDLEAMRRTRWREKVRAVYSVLHRHLAFVDQARNARVVVDI